MKPLQPFFAPHRVAVIGATDKPGSVGPAVVENLAAFSGELLLVNRKHPEVLGRPTLARIADLPAGTDLAIVVTPAPTVPEILRECAAAGIGAVVVISAEPDPARIAALQAQGVRGHLRKPFRPESVRDVITNLFGGPHA